MLNWKSENGGFQFDRPISNGSGCALITIPAIVGYIYSTIR